MVRGCHFRFDARIQLNGEVSRVRFWAAFDVIDCPVDFRELASVQIVSWTPGLCKQREVPERGTLDPLLATAALEAQVSNSRRQCPNHACARTP